MNTLVNAPAILLVEDNPMDLDLTLRAFAKKKFVNQVHVARDGEEALAYFPRWEAGEALPAVILLDINLPKIGGLEVLRQLKAHEHFSPYPGGGAGVIKEDRDLKTAYDLGVNSYIEKPVSFQKFMEVADQIELYWCVLNERPA
ncbi:MAG: response regulator [Burkholderiaceae bacterium]